MSISPAPALAASMPELLLISLPSFCSMLNVLAFVALVVMAVMAELLVPVTSPDVLTMVLPVALLFVATIPVIAPRIVPSLWVMLRSFAESWLVTVMPYCDVP